MGLVVHGKSSETLELRGASVLQLTEFSLQVHSVGARSPLPPGHGPVCVELRAEVLVPAGEALHAALPRLDALPEVFVARISDKEQGVFKSSYCSM